MSDCLPCLLCSCTRTPVNFRQTAINRYWSDFWRLYPKDQGDGVRREVGGTGRRTGESGERNGVSGAQVVRGTVTLSDTPPQTLRGSVGVLQGLGVGLAGTVGDQSDVTTVVVAEGPVARAIRSCRPPVTPAEPPPKRRRGPPPRVKRQETCNPHTRGSLGPRLYSRKDNGNQVIGEW